MATSYTVTFERIGRTRTVAPGGWMALAVPRGPGGGWDGESVGLYYANRKAVVLRVCGAEVLPWAAH